VGVTTNYTKNHQSTKSLERLALFGRFALRALVPLWFKFLSKELSERVRSGAEAERVLEILLPTTIKIREIFLVCLSVRIFLYQQAHRKLNRNSQKETHLHKWNEYCCVLGLKWKLRSEYQQSLHAHGWSQSARQLAHSSANPKKSRVLPNP
jgi:hypothetical protein